MGREIEMAIRAVAAARGHYSLRALARAARLDRRTVVRSARGLISPRPATVEALAAALGVSSASLREMLAQGGDGA